MIAGRYIKNGQIDWSMADHIPFWRYTESPEIALKNGDVIFTKDGSHLGNPAVVTNIHFEATLNGTMMLVRPQKELNSQFLYQVLCGNKFKKLIHVKVSGSGIPHLFQSDMKSFEFFCPKNIEQVTISNFLLHLDLLIASNQRNLNKPLWTHPP